MRRSSAIKLTLLPMLATAAVAAAEPPLPPGDPISPPGSQDPAPPPADPSQQLGLAPPGMTPALRELDCDSDPNWRLRDDCDFEDDVYVSGGVVRGGFGNYFWAGGGGYYSGHGG